MNKSPPVIPKLNLKGLISSDFDSNIDDNKMSGFNNTFANLKDISTFDSSDKKEDIFNKTSNKALMPKIPPLVFP